MAVSSPKVPVFCIVRGRWYQTTDLFDNRDWLVKTYADWFVAGSGSATVPLVESGPKPPTTGGGGSGGADPRVDGLIARIVALETAGGSGADPRVDGLIARVGEVEAAAGKATEKAEKAAVTASTAASEAGNANAAAEQAAVTAGQAKSKAEEVSGELGTVRSQAGSAEAKATAAESKAVEAANTAQQAQLSVISADQTAKAAKAVTDNLERLGVPNTYTTLQTTVRLAKQSADNAEIIANGVSRKLEAIEEWKTEMPASSELAEISAKLKSGLAWTVTKDKDLENNEAVSAASLIGVYAVRNNDYQNAIRLVVPGTMNSRATSVTVAAGEAVHFVSSGVGGVILGPGAQPVKFEQFTVATYGYAKPSLYRLTQKI